MSLAKLQNCATSVTLKMPTQRKKGSPSATPARPSSQKTTRFATKKSSTLPISHMRPTLRATAS